MFIDRVGSSTANRQHDGRGDAQPVAEALLQTRLVIAACQPQHLACEFAQAHDHAVVFLGADQPDTLCVAPLLTQLHCMMNMRLESVCSC